VKIQKSNFSVLDSNLTFHSRINVPMN